MITSLEIKHFMIVELPMLCASALTLKSNSFFHHWGKTEQGNHQPLSLTALLWWMFS